jgi:hypothetical protein
MHPEFLREMTDLRGREMRARARQARLARLARLVGRRGGDQPESVADQFAIPAIPDYVDGSFRTEPAASEPAAGEAVTEAGQAPATHHAA